MGPWSYFHGHVPTFRIHCLEASQNEEIVVSSNELLDGLHRTGSEVWQDRWSFVFVILRLR